MDDIYLSTFSNDLKESIKKKLDKSGRVIEIWKKQ